MSDLLYRLINEAPDGVTVKDTGTHNGRRVIQWWACERYGISLRTGEGYHWAEAPAEEELWFGPAEAPFRFEGEMG
jgi:hypothetical protein